MCPEFPCQNCCDAAYFQLFFKRQIRNAIVVRRFGKQSVKSLLRGGFQFGW